MTMVSRILSEVLERLEHSQVSEGMKTPVTNMLMLMHAVRLYLDVQQNMLPCDDPEINRRIEAVRVELAKIDITALAAATYAYMMYALARTIARNEEGRSND
jgi:hypothetical protein